jgi:hypothetical protein
VSCAEVLIWFIVAELAAGVLTFGVCALVYVFRTRK